MKITMKTMENPLRTAWSHGNGLQELLGWSLEVDIDVRVLLIFQHMP